jgi:hypothetical protein
MTFCNWDNYIKRYIKKLSTLNLQQHNIRSSNWKEKKNSESEESTILFFIKSKLHAIFF